MWGQGGDWVTVRGQFGDSEITVWGQCGDSGDSVGKG